MWSRAFYKNQVRSYVLFLLEYQSAHSLLTVSKNRMSEKNLFLELWSQNAGFKL